MTTYPHATYAEQVTGERSAARTSRRWAFTGAAAGLAGLVGIGASMTVDAAYDPAIAGQPDKIVDRLAELTANILVFHTATMLSVVLMLVFAAGLRRRLRETTPDGSLLPDVAAAGLWLVSVAGLMGTGLTTEFVFGVTGAQDQLVPEVAVFFAHWVGTIAWLWVGAGVAGVALAVAALRHGAAPRWIGWVALVLGGLTLLTGVSPLQYMAGFPGPVLVLVAGLGFALGDRAHR